MARHACKRTREMVLPSAGFKEISVQEAAALRDGATDEIVLLDVRTPEEYGEESCACLHMCTAAMHATADRSYAFTTVVQQTGMLPAPSMCRWTRSPQL